MYVQDIAAGELLLHLSKHQHGSENAFFECEPVRNVSIVDHFDAVHIAAARQKTLLAGAVGRQYLDAMSSFDERAREFVCAARLSSVLPGRIKVGNHEGNLQLRFSYKASNASSRRFPVLLPHVFGNTQTRISSSHETMVRAM